MSQTRCRRGGAHLSGLRPFGFALPFAASASGRVSLKALLTNASGLRDHVAMAFTLEQGGAFGPNHLPSDNARGKARRRELRPQPSPQRQLSIAGLGW